MRDCCKCNETYELKVEPPTFAQRFANNKH